MLYGCLWHLWGKDPAKWAEPTPGTKHKRRGQKKLFCTTWSASGDLFAEWLGHSLASEWGVEIWHEGSMSCQGFAMGLSPASHPAAASLWFVWGVSPGTSWFYSPANEPWDCQSGMRPWDFCPFVISKATFRKLCYNLLQLHSELLRGLEVPRLNWPVQIQLTVQSWFKKDI